jgi:RNA polymerase sigma factor (sigma-70 family)
LKEIMLISCVARFSAKKWGRDEKSRIAAPRSYSRIGAPRETMRFAPRRRDRWTDRRSSRAGWSTPSPTRWLSGVRSCSRVTRIWRDLLQEAYKRAWEHRDEIESEEHLHNWLRFVVNRLASDHRRRKKNQTQVLGQAEAIPDDRPHLLEAETREYVRHYVDQLPADERRLIELRYFQELKLEEIQELHPELGRVSWLSRKLQKACERLRALMSEEGPGAP